MLTGFVEPSLIIPIFNLVVRSELAMQRYSEKPSWSITIPWH